MCPCKPGTSWHWATWPMRRELPAPAESLPPDVVALCVLSVDDWARTLVDLLPRGIVWPRDPETVIWRFWMAIGDAMVAIQTRDCALLDASYPCLPGDLLPEWMATVGL